MEYSGWTLYDKITLVIKKEKHTVYQLPQAYVVDAKDTKQLKRAKEWGTMKSVRRDENQIILRDDNGVALTDTIEPDVITLDNKGFKITLLDYAHGSSQGGKLSFWNCIIEHKEADIKCVVGIAADLLLTLLIQNKFLYGTCDSEVFFARQSGSVGLLTEAMVEYQHALKDMQLKKTINTKKTNKWQVGHSYRTLTLDETYFGGVYTLLDSTKNPEKTNYYSDEPYYIINSNIIYSNIICNTSMIPENIHKASELEQYLIEVCNSNVEKIHNHFKDIHANRGLTKIMDGMYPLFLRSTYVRGNKFPSRQPGERVIEQDKSFDEVFTNVIKYVQKCALELLEKYTITDMKYLASSLLIRTSKFNPELDDLDELEIKLLRYLMLYNNKDRSDYKLSGRLLDIITKID